MACAVKQAQVDDDAWTWCPLCAKRWAGDLGVGLAAAAAAAAAASPLECRICESTEEGPAQSIHEAPAGAEDVGALLSCACICRGNAAKPVHLACAVKAAQLGEAKQCGHNSWLNCPRCKHKWGGELKLPLARERCDFRPIFDTVPAHSLALWAHVSVNLRRSALIAAAENLEGKQTTRPNHNLISGVTSDRLLMVPAAERQAAAEIEAAERKAAAKLRTPAQITDDEGQGLNEPYEPYTGVYSKERLAADMDLSRALRLAGQAAESLQIGGQALLRFTGARQEDKQVRVCCVK